MKRIIPLFLTALVLCGLSFAQTSIQEGIASWYGAEFAGRPTASGEPFNPSDFTAAHPTLPFGTMLRITSKHNSKTVNVRVNDRGPFVSARVIDVSRAAAEQLDMISTGTAPVIIEILSQEAKAPPSPPPPVVETPPPPLPVPAPALRAELKGPAPEAGRRYRLQVGSYRLPRNAAESFEKLKEAGLEPAYERHEDFYRVVLAGVRGEDISLLLDKLGAAGFREALIREER